MNTETKTQPRIFARDMLTAQAFTLTAAQRADLVARADRFRQISGTTAKTSITVPVYDVYAQAHQIGTLTFTNL